MRKLLLLLLVATASACQGQNPLADPTVTPLPPTNTPAPTLTATPDPNEIAGFNVFLAEAQNARGEARQNLADRYIAQLVSTPITGENQAVFLWRGEAQSVGLVGDMNNWDPASAWPLSRLEGTDLWYLTADLEADARLDYKYISDGGQPALDPLNPRTIVSGFGPNSELAMPGYVTPAELLPSEDIVPVGSVTPHTLESQYLNQTRTFYVYAPPGQIIGERLPSVYINDGADYLNLIDTPVILDRLIAGRQIPPLVAVFVTPLNRNLEYSRSREYVSFLADELVPFVRTTYDTDPDPTQTGALGASLGGLAAVHAALSRPDVFGLAASQSGAFSLDNHAILNDATSRLADQVTPFLVVGSYERSVGGSIGGGDLLEANRRLASALEERGFEVRYEERPEGHSWGLWRGTLGEALGFLFQR